MNHYDVYLVDTQILTVNEAVAGTEEQFVSEFSFSTNLEAEAFILGISVADRYQEGEIRGFRTRWEALAHAKLAIEANLHPYNDENGYQ